MTNRAGIGLARVTIATPKRRADVALPDDAVVAELMPGLLRHAGADLADEGQSHGGWVLRRTDGAVVEQGRSLSVQDIRDGEVLHLVPREAEWPELDYDDVVDAIATGARRQSRSWGSSATRRAGISASAGALLVGLVLLLSSGPDWTLPGGIALAIGAVLLAIAAALARAVADTASGAVIGAVAMAYAFGGGLVILAGDRSVFQAEAPQFLLASAALLVSSVIAFAVVGDRGQYFVAGTVVGFLGVVGALLGRVSYLKTSDIAAILIAVVVTFTPMFPLLSIRLGKLPMPTLPTSAEDLLADPPRVAPSRVRATVRRSDELLTGMLLGTAAIAIFAQIMLVLDGGTGALILVAVVSVATMLRSRLFPTLRHRIPLLATGLVGILSLALGILSQPPEFRLAVGVPAMFVLALILLAAAIYYQDKVPSPYFGRIADILDVLMAVAVVPVACIVIGLFGYMRGLYG